MYKKIFSKRLKALREKYNLTQKEFVDGLSITAPTLSAYEKCVSNPSVAVIAEISKKFSVSTDWLLGLSNNTIIENKISDVKSLISIITCISLLDTPKVELLTPESYSSPFDYFNHYAFGWDVRKISKEFYALLKDVYKMSSLLKEGSIDNDVFNLWLEKTYKKFENFKLFDLVSPDKELISDSDDDLPY